MHLQEEPLVSVVTPVYNGEPYLAECIESVLAQTYQNWEYTIVNNCSTDRSLEIAQYYANKDQRIRVHNNNAFLDVRKNFNHGLRQISLRSKYCKIVQADDWLFPECLRLMVKVADENPSIGIVGAYRLDNRQVNCAGLPSQTTVISGREVCRLSLFNGLYVFGSPTSLLVRSDIVRKRGPFYNESSLHSDTEACYEILQNYDFGFVHQVLTFSRRDNESISSKTVTYRRELLDRFIAISKFGPIYLSAAEYQRCYKETKKTYFRFLGRSIFAMKSKEFWDYHREGLQTIGFKLGFASLLGPAFIAFLDLLCNPKLTIERSVKKLKNLQPRHIPSLLFRMK